MTLKKKLVGVVMLGVGVWSIASSATAVTAYHGSDYAYNIGSSQAAICDREVDGHQVMVGYTRRSLGYGNEIEERGNGNCSTSESRNDPIWRIKACENDWTGFWNCGGWVNTGY